MCEFVLRKFSIFGNIIITWRETISVQTMPLDWNFLPLSLRESDSSIAFRSSLKTHLFRLTARWSIELEGTRHPFSGFRSLKFYFIFFLYFFCEGRLPQYALRAWWTKEHSKNQSIIIIVMAPSELNKQSPLLTATEISSGHHTRCGCDVSPL